MSIYEKDWLHDQPILYSENQMVISQTIDERMSPPRPMAILPAIQLPSEFYAINTLEGRMMTYSASRRAMMRTDCGIGLSDATTR